MVLFSPIVTASGYSSSMYTNWLIQTPFPIL